MFSPFASKIRTGLAERVGLTGRVAAFRKRIGDKPVLLFHCASAGELEALKPLAHRFDKNGVALAVSYFSPSARSALKKSDEFDFSDYSPIDSQTRVKQYLDALRPSVIAITKHDIWPNLVWQAHDRGIPVFLINGNFHADSLRLWPVVRQFHASIYTAFTEIMTVSEKDALQAHRFVGKQVPVRAMGDSRFDRVLARAQRRAELPAGIEQACAGKPVIVAGSSHPDDEQLLLPVLTKLAAALPGLLTVIVPHDPSPKARRRILDMCGQHKLKVHDLEAGAVPKDTRVILINRTGILADLYRVGQVAYVGGGFGKGVHSVLEPMANGLPVICGPNIVVSNEAGIAKEKGILSVVAGRKPLETQLLEWFNKDVLASLRERVQVFVKEHTGATDRIAARLNEALHG
ncbi:MAG TPA: glycosyltransferase N-terminal domain-containing protein [bacterium]